MAALIGDRGSMEHAASSKYPPATLMIKLRATLAKSMSVAATVSTGMTTSGKSTYSTPSEGCRKRTGVRAVQSRMSPTTPICVQVDADLYMSPWYPNAGARIVRSARHSNQ